MQNGACYIRVSTDDQTEYSPDAQLKAIKEYAKRNDIILSKQHIFIDEGISGKTANKRPAFMEMIATAKIKPTPFDVILVHKFDRFARSREDSVVYKSLLKKEAGIKVVSITEKIEDDKFAVILEAMLEAMAEYYSLNLSDEVKKGMTEKAIRGEVQTTPAFGYRIEDNKLIVVEEEAEIIRFIFQKFASYEMSLLSLAVYVNDLGIKTKRGNKFENRSIDYILNNPVYIGKLRWNPNERTKRNFSNPNNIIAEGKHEPLIDIDTWNKAQERIKLNKELYIKKQKQDVNIKTWLHGLIKCGNCGKTLVVTNKEYLQCNGYAKGQCKISHSVKISIIENLILEEIKKTFTENIEINIVPKQSDESSTIEYDLLMNSLEKMDLKLTRIKEAFQDGIDTLEEYKENKLKIDNERKNLNEQLKKLKDKLLNHKEEKPIIKVIESAYDILNDEKNDMDLKYKTSHFLINKATFFKKEKTLTLEYK